MHLLGHTADEVEVDIFSSEFLFTSRWLFVHCKMLHVHYAIFRMRDMFRQSLVTSLPRSERNVNVTGTDAGGYVAPLRPPITWLKVPIWLRYRCGYLIAYPHRGILTVTHCNVAWYHILLIFITIHLQMVSAIRKLLEVMVSISIIYLYTYVYIDTIW